MRNDIKFAGFLLNWTHDYAKSYSKKLKEMGYSVRLIKNDEYYIIAYSYKSFTIDESIEVFNNM